MRAVASGPKVLAVASSGGHWVQLMELEEAWRGLEVVYATTGEGQPVNADNDLRQLPDANLDDKLGLFRLAWHVFRLVSSVRPDIVVSTGAAPGFFVVVFAKLVLRSQTIWVDSVANVEQISKSGKWVRRFADEWLVQWPDLAAATGAKFQGSVL